MNYKLLQIKDVENCPYVFGGFNTAMKNNFSLDDYEVVYTGNIKAGEATEILEVLFDIFNISHPTDFTGRSMSVSDVVDLDGKLYYCDHVGFKEITRLR